MECELVLASMAVLDGGECIVKEVRLGGIHFRQAYMRSQQVPEHQKQCSHNLGMLSKQEIQ